MKATARIFYDKWHPDSKGVCGISLRVTFLRKHKFYKTEYRLLQQDFNRAIGITEGGEDLPKSKLTAKQANEIRMKLNLREVKAVEIIRDMPVFTWQNFERRFLVDAAMYGTIKQAFDTYATELRQQGRIGTAVSYECAISSLGSTKRKPLSRT